MAKKRRTSLDAVVRVRELREQASLMGMHTAKMEHQQAVERCVQTEQRLADHTVAVSTDLPANAWVQGRSDLEFLMGSLRSAERTADESVVVSDLAREHWLLDRQRLKAVEDLRERRLERAAEELAKKVAGDLDEIAQQLWLRSNREVSA